jgi:hypothetical protein
LILLTFAQDLFIKDVAEFAGIEEVTPKIRTEVIVTVLNLLLILKGYPLKPTFVTENFGQTIYR